MKSISSHPDAAKYRSTLVIILILTCIAGFFSYTSSLNQRVEELAIKQVVTDMRGAAAMMLYDYAIKGQLRNLRLFDRESPFIPLAIYRKVPDNFEGTINNDSEMTKKGWYFNLTTRRAIYNYANQDKPNRAFVMRFEFEDLDLDGEYDENEVGYLEIKKADFGTEISSS